MDAQKRELLEGLLNGPPVSPKRVLLYEMCKSAGIALGAPIQGVVGFELTDAEMDELRERVLK